MLLLLLVVVLLLPVVPAVVPAVMLLVGATGHLYVTPPPRCSPSPPWRAGFCFVRSPLLPCLMACVALTSLFRG